jgi:hypothetical protein
MSPCVASCATVSQKSFGTKTPSLEVAQSKVSATRKREASAVMFLGNSRRCSCQGNTFFGFRAGSFVCLHRLTGAGEFINNQFSPGGRERFSRPFQWSQSLKLIQLADAASRQLPKRAQCPRGASHRAHSTTVLSRSLCGSVILIPKVPQTSQTDLNSISAAAAEIMLHLRDAFDQPPFARGAACVASWGRQREVATARALVQRL